MKFGDALDAMEEGKKVTRKGWNGPGQFVVMQKGYPEGIKINGNTSEALGLPEGTVCKFEPYAMIKTAQGTHVSWQPTQSDMFGKDWKIVEDA